MNKIKHGLLALSVFLSGCAGVDRNVNYSIHDIEEKIIREAVQDSAYEAFVEIKKKVHGDALKATHDPAYSGKKLDQGKYNPAIVIVDMQDKFLFDIQPKEMRDELLPNQIKVLKCAQENNIPIYVLEYENSGNTDERLGEVLSNSCYEIITKPEDDGFVDTRLDKILKDNGIEQIILMGIYASSCVKKTALGGIERGYKIATSLDVISEPTYIEGDESVNWYKSHGRMFNGVEEILEYLKTPREDIAYRENSQIATFKLKQRIL